MNPFPFRMPDDLKATVAAQAERTGVSPNQYLLAIVATHAGSQVEAERYFAARAARSSSAQALDILARAGHGQPPEPGDELRRIWRREHSSLRRLLPCQYR